MYVLGYLSKDNRIYVCDKEMTISSFPFPHNYVSYQLLVLEKNMEEANTVSEHFSSDLKNKAAVFLQEQVYLMLI